MTDSKTGWQEPVTWQPLLHEAGIASYSIGMGLTSLRKANYAEPMRYYGAFFQFSIGLERLMKLTLYVDALCVNSAALTENDLKNGYGHDLRKLFIGVESVRERVVFALKIWDICEPEVTHIIINLLADFAKGARYYNLDVLAGKEPAIDPVARWFGEVGNQLLAVRPKKSTRNTQWASEVDSMLLGKSQIRHTAEDGTSIESIHEAAKASDRSEYVAKTGTFLCAALVRHIASIFHARCYDARSNGHAIPYIEEFFHRFENEDAMLKRWKTFLS